MRRFKELPMPKLSLWLVFCENEKGSWWVIYHLCCLPFKYQSSWFSSYLTKERDLRMLERKMSKATKRSTFSKVKRKTVTKRSECKVTTKQSLKICCLTRRLIMTSLVAQRCPLCFREWQASKILGLHFYNLHFETLATVTLVVVVTLWAEWKLFLNILFPPRETWEHNVHLCQSCSIAASTWIQVNVLKYNVIVIVYHEHLFPTVHLKGFPSPQHVPQLQSSTWANQTVHRIHLSVSILFISFDF